MFLSREFIHEIETKQWQSLDEEDACHFELNFSAISNQKDCSMKEFNKLGANESIMLHDMLENYKKEIDRNKDSGSMEIFQSLHHELKQYLDDYTFSMQHD
jgi:hypothetical protein